MITDKEYTRLKNFTRRNIEFSKAIISQYYPFERKELHKYANVLSWENVTVNEIISWDKAFGQEFYDKIVLRSLGYNESFPWDEEFIERYYFELFDLNHETEGDENDKYLITDEAIEEIFGGEIKWEGLAMSGNPKLPFSKNFIEKYKSLWRWGILSRNSGIPFTIDLIDEFKDYWDYKAFEHNRTIAANPVLKFYTGVNNDMRLTTLPHECEYCDKDMYYVCDRNKINLNKLFGCLNFKWDFYLLRLIKEKFDKEVELKDNMIYIEESITAPWSIELIELFEGYWNYYMLCTNEYVGRLFINIIKKNNALEDILSGLIGEYN